MLPVSRGSQCQALSSVASLFGAFSGFLYRQCLISFLLSRVYAHPTSPIPCVQSVTDQESLTITQSNYHNNTAHNARHSIPLMLTALLRHNVASLIYSVPCTDIAARHDTQHTHSIPLVVIPRGKYHISAAQNITLLGESKCNVGVEIAGWWCTSMGFAHYNRFSTVFIDSNCWSYIKNNVSVDSHRWSQYIQKYISEAIAGHNRFPFVSEVFFFRESYE